MSQQQQQNCAHCSNGATCVVLGDQLTDYKCLCLSGFRGRHCEDDQDECESRLSMVCPPGVQCVNTFGGYTCHCPAGQVMLRSACVRKLACRDGMCRNGALCYNVQGEHRDYVCECELGFRGVDCEVRVQECSPENVCGEHGVCVATQNGRRRISFLPSFPGQLWGKNMLGIFTFGLFSRCHEELIMTS